MNLTTLRTGLFGELAENLLGFFENPDLFDKYIPLVKLAEKFKLLGLNYILLRCLWAKERSNFPQTK